MQQIANRHAGLVHGLVFNALGGGVQRHDHGRFGPLANDEGAGDGHRHQRMNAQLEAKQILDARLVNPQPRERNTDHGQRHAQVLQHHIRAIAAKPVAGLGRQSRCQRRVNARPAGQHAVVVPVVMAIVLVMIVVMALGGLADGKCCAAAGTAGGISGFCY